MPNFRPASDVDYTGTIAGSPAASVASNAATAFTGTAAYRVDAAPTNNAAFSTITQTATADGNIVVTIPYTYTQGANKADSIIVFYRETGGTVVAGDPAFITNAVSGSITFTLKPSVTYSFGLQAVRRTESGLVGTAILSSSNVTLNAGNYTGNIAGSPAATVVANASSGATAATNFNTRNDRNPTIPAAPTFSPNGEAVDHTLNTDGSANISFEWNYTLGTSPLHPNNIDGYIVYVKTDVSPASTASYTFGTSPADEVTYTVDKDRRAFVLPSVSADRFYRFGVQAYRAVDNDIAASGVVYSTIAKPPHSSESPYYRPATSIAFAGNITGTIAGSPASTVVANAADGATAFTGTAKYRTAGAPTNLPVPTSIVSTSNSNATKTIRISWAEYIQGANQADVIGIFYRRDNNIPTYIDTCVIMNVNINTPGVFELTGVNPSDTYSFGIAAGRRTEDGIEWGVINTTYGTSPYYLYSSSYTLGTPIGGATTSPNTDYTPNGESTIKVTDNSVNFQSTAWLVSSISNPTMERWMAEAWIKQETGTTKTALFRVYSSSTSRGDIVFNPTNGTVITVTGPLTEEGYVETVLKDGVTWYRVGISADISPNLTGIQAELYPTIGTIPSSAYSPDASGPGLVIGGVNIRKRTNSNTGFDWTGITADTVNFTGNIAGSAAATVVANAAFGAAIPTSGSLTTAAFASSIEPVTLVTSVPGTKSTNTIFNTTDGKLYRWNSPTYVATVPTVDLTGTVSPSQIADQAITTAKFASGIEPVQIVTSVPGTKSTNTIFNTTDGKLYRWNSPTYVATVPTVDLTGTVSPSQIADQAITTAKFASGIEPVQIVTSVPGTKSTNTIFNTTDGKLYRWNSPTYVATVPTVDLTGTIVSSQLATINNSNLLDNPNFEAGQVGWTNPTRIIQSSPDAYQGDWVMKFDSSSSANNLISLSNKIYVEPGESYKFSGYLRASPGATGNFYWQARWYNSSGAVARFDNLSVPAATTSWTQVSSILTASPGHVWVQFAPYTAAVGTFYWDQASVTRAVTSDIVADQAITLTKFASGIEPIEIVASSPTTGNFQGRTIFLTTDNKIYRYTGSAWTTATDGADIVANSITGGKIQAGAIGASEIAAGAITTTKLAVADSSRVFGEIFDYSPSLTEWTNYTGSGELSIVSDTEARFGGKALQVGNNSGNDQAWLVHNRNIPFDPNTTYRTRVRIRKTAGAGTVYAGWVGIGADGSTLVDTSGGANVGSQHYHTVANRSPISTYTEYVGYTKGFGATVGTGGETNSSSPGQMHPDVRYIRPVIILNYQNLAGTMLVDSITADVVSDGTLIADGAITASKITASTITGDKIAGNTITASNIAADTITAGQIAAGAISTSELAANAVTSSKLAVGDFTVQNRNWNFEDGDTQWVKESGWTVESSPSVAKSGSWVAKKVNTTSAALRNAQRVPVTQGETFYAEGYLQHSGATGTGSYVRIGGYNSSGGDVGFGTGNIVSPSITTYTLSSATYTVPAGVVGIDVQVVSTLTAGTAYADEVRLFRTSNTTLIADGAITTNKITASAITGDKIAANTITSSKLLVTDMSNMAQDPMMVDNASWVNTAGTPWTVWGTSASEDATFRSTRFMKITGASGSYAGFFYSKWMPIEPGQSYYITAQGRSVGGVALGAAMNLEWADDENRTNYTETNFTSTGSDTPVDVSITVTAPSKRFLRVRFYKNNNTVTEVRWGGLIVRRRTSGELIVDGSVTAAKIAADTITAGQIAAGAITATQIAANTITASQIAAGTITATQIASDTITTEKLLIGPGNLVPNSDFATGTFAGWYNWTNASYQSIVLNSDVGVPAGAPSKYVARYQYTGAGLNIGAFASTRPYSIAGSDKDGFAVTPGEIYQAIIKAAKSSDFASSTFQVTAYYYKSNGVYTTSTIAINNPTLTTSWATYEGSFTVPADATRCWMYVIVGAQTAGTLWWTQLRVTKKADSNLIVDGAITAAKIAASTITGDKIAGNTITASNIAADTITAGQIAAGAISTSELAANAVTASKIAIGDFQNLCPNPSGETGVDGWTGVVTGPNTGIGGLPATVKSLRTTNRDAYIGPWIDVTPGDEFYLSGNFYPAQSGDNPPTANAAVMVRFAEDVNGTNSAWLYSAYADRTVNSWQTVEGSITVPAGKRFAQMAVQINGTAGSTGSWHFRNIQIRRRNSGALIVDGAITAAKIAASTITGNKIAGNTITASNIAADTITAGQIAAGAITASEIAAGAVTVNKLAVVPVSLNPDPYFSDLSFWTPDALGWYWEGAAAAVPFSNTPAQFALWSAHPTNAPGTARKHVYSGYTMAPAVGTTLRLRTRTNNSSNQNVAIVADFFDSDYGYTGAIFLLSAAGEGLKDLTGQGVVPNNTKYVRFLFYNDGGTTFAGAASVSAIMLDVASSADLLVDGSITAGKIAASTITGDKIAGNTITASNIAADTITASQIAAGAISTSELAANAVTSSKLAVGDFTVQNRNWNFEDGDTQWGKESGWTIESSPSAAKSGSWVAKKVNTTPAALRNTQKVNVEPGETFYAEAYIKHAAGSTGSGSRVRCIAFNAAGGEVQYFYGNFISTATTTYSKSSVSFAVTTTGTPVTLDVEIESTLTAGTAYADEVRLFRTSNTTLIADGAITTNKITASAITGDKITASAITSRELAISTTSPSAPSATGIFMDGTGGTGPKIDVYNAGVLRVRIGRLS